MLSASIVVLAMSGGVAAAAPDTNSVLVVDTIAEVDFGHLPTTMCRGSGPVHHRKDARWERGPRAAPLTS